MKCETYGNEKLCWRSCLPEGAEDLFLWELGCFVAFGRLDPLLDLSVLSPVLLHVVMSEFLIAAQ